MKQKIYFVAMTYSSQVLNPTIVERFNSKADAESYAALMSRAKSKNYIVLEQQTEWIGKEK